jgi:hypothetical protein
VELLTSDDVILSEMRFLPSVATTVALLFVGLFALFALGIVHGGSRQVSTCPSPPPSVIQSPESPANTAGTGSQVETPGVYVSSSPNTPQVVAGHVQVTRANAGQTITVPRGTVIDVLLVNGPWSVPSGSGGLTPISAHVACNGDVQASFRADHSGNITSELKSLELGFRFELHILVNE